MADTETPRVWVGCLGCYNAGGLVGAWVDGIEAESLEPHDQAAVSMAPLCGDPKAEERWCMDHEGYAGLLTGECSPMEAQRIAETIEAIQAAGFPVAAVAEYLANMGDSIDPWDEISDGFEDAFCGEWDSGEAYAEDLADQIGAVNPEARWPNDCIDWERAWRELEVGGDNYSIQAPHGVYVFRSA